MASNGNGENRGEKVNTDIITLTRFLTEEQSKHKEATGDFTYVHHSYDQVKLCKTDRCGYQTTLPCLAIRIQEHCLLHPESNLDQRTQSQ
jgi:hypothetical protein